ncbi:hypothetical protein [Winogradskyella helgolandensis]|uniref:hypothetical protein n=1 Tax=Winogradskyella helgolandensis TaxID=2697010 RepID=UPI0015C8CAD3|nr:hypothetical protein [Winogradskyella helgolandensis]
MRILTIIAIFIGFFNSANSQQYELNELKNLSVNDTLWIDYKTGGCFSGNWNKVIITKKEQYYEYIRIENMTKILVEYKQVLSSPKQIDNWFRKNFQQIIKPENISKAKEKNHELNISTLIKTIEYYRKCNSDFEGEYSTIKINLNSIEKKIQL